MGHGFEMVEDDKKAQIGLDYQQQIDRLIEHHGGIRLSIRAPSELSDYSVRLDKKISQI